LSQFTDNKRELQNFNETSLHPSDAILYKCHYI